MIIGDLQTIDVLSENDSTVVCEAYSFDMRKITLKSLLRLIKVAVPILHGTHESQHFAVYNAGFSAVVADTDKWIWVFIDAQSLLASGTIVFPPNPFDGQLIWTTFSHDITWCTFDGNGYPVDIWFFGHVQVVYSRTYRFIFSEHLGRWRTYF